MGNHQQKRQGAMMINFDKPFYYPGDIITGTVFLNVLEAFDTKGLELSLKIKESVKWEEIHMKTESRVVYDEVTKQEKHEPHQVEHRVERKEDKTLYKSCFMIATMQNNVFGYGQYAYPFQFSLPQNLPGSFEYYDHDVSSNIKYTVKAKSLSYHDHRSELEAKSILVVRQPSQYFQYPTNLSNTKEIKTWCFFSQGSATLNVSYPKNNFCQDESVQIICSLNNTNCKINATCIKLQLFQRITLRITDKQGTPHTKILNRCIAQTRYEGNYSAGQDCVRTLELALTDHNNPTLKYLEKCKHRKYFRDPNHAAKLQASTKSMLIECSYYINASTEYSGCLCCSGYPSIDIPVIIYIPELYGDINSFRPQNWNPQVMPMYQINIPADQVGYSSNMNIGFNSNSNFNYTSQPQQNANMNSYMPPQNNFNNNQPYSGMMTTSYEPIQVNNNQQSVGMMTTAYEPMQVNNGGMMNNGSQPYKNY